MPYASSESSKAIEVAGAPLPMEWWAIALVGGAAALALVAGVIIYQEEEKRRTVAK